VNSVCTPSLLVIERERDKERDKEGGRESEKEREIVREKEGGRERGRKRCPKLLFIFLKGMTGVLATFSYLVYYRHADCCYAEYCYNKCCYA
jgi:hypothetical protein